MNPVSATRTTDSDLEVVSSAVAGPGSFAAVEDGDSDVSPWEEQGEQDQEEEDEEDNEGEQQQEQEQEQERVNTQPSFFRRRLLRHRTSSSGNSNSTGSSSRRRPRPGEADSSGRVAGIVDRARRLLRLGVIDTMGLAYNTYLNSNRIYGCKGCKAHLANHEDIISRNFRGQHGKAYLFNTVVNVDTGEPSERNMTTGRHIVRDITCRSCGETVGWKYDKAYEQSEKYKEGKFILEAELLCMVS